jgi:hypothetical protein
VDGGFIFTYWGTISGAANIYSNKVAGTCAFPGLNLTVWNMQESNDKAFYENWKPWETGIPEANLTSICADHAYVLNIDYPEFLSINDCQNVGDHFDVVARITGYITPPDSGEVRFCDGSDDGFFLKIGGSMVISDWYQHPDGIPCNRGDQSHGSYSFTAGVPVPIEVWWFQNDGGEALTLSYDNGGEWIPVPVSWFSPATPVSVSANCGLLDSGVCPTATVVRTNRVVGAPGPDQMARRATYTWLRCKSEGDALISRRAPRNCRVVQRRRSTGVLMAKRPYRITTADRRAGYLRLAVTIGRTTYYSGTLNLKP